MQKSNREPILHDERLERLARFISTRTMEGWNVVDRNDQEVFAVLSLPGKPVNHVLHAILTVLTCFLYGYSWLRRKEKSSGSVFR